MPVLAKQRRGHEGVVVVKTYFSFIFDEVLWDETMAINFIHDRFKLGFFPFEGSRIVAAAGVMDHPGALLVHVGRNGTQSRLTINWR